MPFPAKPVADSPVDNYVRTSLAGDDTKLYLTALGGGSIVGLAGQDGSGSPTPRLQRLPGGTVQANGHNYSFDGLGRVSSAQTENLALDGSASRNTNLQRQAGGSDRLAKDDGGHIVGHRFNPPTEEFNLFAQDANFNRGTYRSMEGLWSSALRQGQTVEVEWKFEYAGTSLRPEKITVKFWIDGEYFERNFTNAPGGKP